MWTGDYVLFIESPKRALADERMSPARRAARQSHNFSCVPPGAEDDLARLVGARAQVGTQRRSLARLHTLLGICRLWSRHNDPMQLRDISRDHPATMSGLLRVLHQMLEAQRVAAARAGRGVIEYEEWLRLIFSLNAGPPAPPHVSAHLSAAPFAMSHPSVAESQDHPSPPPAVPPSTQFDSPSRSPYYSPPPLPLPLGWACNDQCTADINEAATSPFSADGTCDDGGMSSRYDVCELGADCTDCGPRDLYTADPPPSKPLSIVPPPQPPPPLPLAQEGWLCADHCKLGLAERVAARLVSECTGRTRGTKPPDE